MIGQVVLDRYLVEEELGAGAMGAVYKGRHVKLKRHVAIKIMHEHLATERVLRERFEREARLAGKLDHKNVVAVLDVGETVEGKPVMVMEYVPGRSLRETMVGPMAQARLIRIVGQILRGLDHAHAMGLVHRDLKPENVIVEGDLADERARIADFGVAALRGRDERDGGKLTATGMIVGSPLYMAPEQAQGEAIDHRADLYALGIMMYEMLSGEWPYFGTAMEVAVAKIQADPPPIADRAPGVPVDPILEAFMRKLAVRSLAHRFASAHDALAVLDLYARDREAAALAVGIMDVSRALAIVSLPEPTG